LIYVNDSAGDQEELTLLSRLKRLKVKNKRLATAYIEWLNQEYYKEKGEENYDK